MTSIDHGRADEITQPSRWPVWMALVGVAAVFVIRFPGIVEPFGPDQGVYATIGWGLQKGLRLYRDLWEVKPPGIYATYWLGFQLLGTTSAAVFWMDYLAALLTTVVLFDLGRRVVGLRYGAIAAIVFALGTLPAARHAYGGFLERAISEVFISLLAAIAAWAAAMAATRPQRRWAILAGLAIGCAVVYKPMSGVYWPALAIWIWWVAGVHRARRFVFESAVGLAIAPTLGVLSLWLTGVFPDAWIALVEFNRAYLAVGDHNPVSILNLLAHQVWLRMKTDEVWALGTLAATVALFVWNQRRTRAGEMASLAIAWLGAAVLAIALNGPRMFQTYFVPSLVPLCLLAAWLIDQTCQLERRRRRAAFVMLAGFTGLMLARSGSITRAAAATTADTQRLFGRVGSDEYLRRFQSRGTAVFSAADIALLADYVRAHTDPRERIFVFGMSAATYFLSERLPASKFLFVYPAVSGLVDRPEFHVETLAAELARAEPRYILFQRNNRDSFSGWHATDSFAAPPMAALLQRYQREPDIGGFEVYRRQ